MAWCWCNATESKPQNVNSNIKRTMRKLLFLFFLGLFFQVLYIILLDFYEYSNFRLYLLFFITILFLHNIIYFGSQLYKKWNDKQHRNILFLFLIFSFPLIIIGKSLIGNRKIENTEHIKQEEIKIYNSKGDQISIDSMSIKNKTIIDSIIKSNN